MGKTSNNDDLEQALRQNLKLRRELGGEVAKALDHSPKQGVGMACRLGWFLFVTCLALGVIWAASLVI